MSTSLDELERLLRLLLADQRRLAETLRAQRESMRTLHAGGIERLTAEAGVIRKRVAASEPRRKAMTLAAARELGLAATDPTLSMIAGAAKDAGRQTRLMALRDELRRAVAEVADAAHVAGRLAGAVLGHLNTAVRVISGAMGEGSGGGAYTRTGSPRVAARLGAIEAVG